MIPGYYLVTRSDLSSHYSWLHAYLDHDRLLGQWGSAWNWPPSLQFDEAYWQSDWGSPSCIEDFPPDYTYHFVDTPSISPNTHPEFFI